MAHEGLNHQLPSYMVAREFGEVNVRGIGDQLEVSFTILMEPDGELAEGWQTGVALDASASMKSWFGRGLSGEVPREVLEVYRQRGWLREQQIDGRQVQSLRSLAFQDALRTGFLKQTPNIVEPWARQFISYLADNLDEDGGTTVIYWACNDGRGFEVVGDFTASQVRRLTLKGPKFHDWGRATHLLPAMKYFVERFRDARRGMYLFLTDGHIDDMEAVQSFTAQLCAEIASGRRNMVKCVLIGVGNRIDQRQLQALDDFDSGTDVDIWDHKIAREMRGVVEIFAEVVNHHQIVAPTARILDENGQTVRLFTDGLPAHVTFRMKRRSAFFELEIGEHRIRQYLAPPRSS